LDFADRADFWDFDFLWKVFSFVAPGFSLKFGFQSKIEQEPYFYVCGFQVVDELFFMCFCQGCNGFQFYNYYLVYQEVCIITANQPPLSVHFDAFLRFHF